MNEVRTATIDGRGATRVGVASALGALSGYIAMVVAARVLGTRENTDFLTFWSLLFWLFGIMTGVQNEITRSVGAARPAGAEGPRGARVVPVGLAVGAAVSGLVLLSSPVWGARVLGDSWVTVAVAVSLGVTAYAGQSSLGGALSGGRHWSTFARVVSVEAISRLALVLAAGLLGSLWGLEVAVLTATLAWLVVCATDRTARAALSTRGDVPWPRLVRNIGHSVLAAVGSAALLVGFAVLLSLTTPTVEYEHAAPLLLAISLTRAPLMVPLTAFQGVAISHFLEHRDQGLGALRRFVLLLAAGGLGIAALAWLAGPPLIRLVFGADYDMPGTHLAALTIGAAVLALVTLTGAAALALGRHTAYAVGWLAAAGTAVLVLLTPLPITGRAVLGLVVGPAVGAVVHAVAIARAGRAAG